MITSFAVAVRKKLDIERITRKFLKKTFPMHLKEPGKLDVEELLSVHLNKKFGYDLFIDDTLDSKVLAETRFLDRKIVFTRSGFKKLIEENGRARFTGCHEAYHVIDHSSQVLAPECILNNFRMQRLNIRFPVYKDSEWQANWGGAALLMPKCTFITYNVELREMGLNHIDALYVITDTYKVSYEAAEKRYNKLKALESTNFKGF